MYNLIMQFVVTAALTVLICLAVLVVVLGGKYE